MRKVNTEKKIVEMLAHGNIYKSKKKKNGRTKKKQKREKLQIKYFGPVSTCSKIVVAAAEAVIQNKRKLVT